MISWCDEGFILSARRHGEASAIVEVFTLSHGRHLGVVSGGGSRKAAATLQAGTQVQLEWCARLESHIGHLKVEAIKSRAMIMRDPLVLAGLNAVCSLLSVTLPERAAHHTLYKETAYFMDMMACGVGGESGWLEIYPRWEILLLESIGFGLDLSSCAVTGKDEDLAYISPRTGCAVSRSGGGKWAPKLFEMPQAMLKQDAVLSLKDILMILKITQHFLSRELAPQLKGRLLPPARDRFVERLKRMYFSTEIGSRDSYLT